VKKHIQYLKYLLRHKWYVYIAGRLTGVSFWRLLIHDWTKFLPCEWFPYTEEFYGEWRTRAEKYPSDAVIHDAFDLAWLHHQKWNKHHWQYWVLPEDTPCNPTGNPKVLKMPEKYAREMLADWMGAGRAITGEWDLAPWYNKNKDNIKLHPATRKIVEYYIH
jgi:hypothetical protein